jgi:hypothetical protein
MSTDVSEEHYAPIMRKEEYAKAGKSGAATERERLCRGPEKKN